MPGIAFLRIPACFTSSTRVRLSPDQIERREYHCRWCNRTLGVRPGKDGMATVPRHKRSEG